MTISTNEKQKPVTEIALQYGKYVRKYCKALRKYCRELRTLPRRSRDFWLSKHILLDYQYVYSK
jgi:hypothetical protein